MQKTILVDAWNTFVLENGVFEPLYVLLETYPHDKIIVTNATPAQQEEFGIINMPYPVFSLHQDPEKTDPQYFHELCRVFHVTPDNLVYFEHNHDAVLSAQSVGIQTYHYDAKSQDLEALKAFLDSAL